jgi:hypothetical protein
MALVVMVGKAYSLSAAADYPNLAGKPTSSIKKSRPANAHKQFDIAPAGRNG